MKRGVFALSIVLAAGGLLAHTTRIEADDDGLAERIERGRYLAHGVAMCVECHSPRDARGNLLRERLFTGGRIPFQSPYPGETWARNAPSLRNMAGYDEAQTIRLLGEGLSRRGDEPQKPMPQYRMSEEDARALYAYLKSL